MTKDKMGGNWSPAEWLKVATMALGLIEQGTSHKEAIKAAQVAVLPRHRWRQPERLAHATAPSMVAWPRYLNQAKAMTPAEREAVLLADAPPPVKTKARAVVEDVPPPAAAPAPAPVVKKPQAPRAKAYGTDDKRPAGAVGIVRWTSREWALIARAAKWVSEHSPGLSLAKQVNEAQVWTLPPDRLRSYGAIVQSFNARSKGQRVLALKLAEGLNNQWTIDKVPFAPPGEQAKEAEELAPPPAVVGQSPEADILTTAAPEAGWALPSPLLTEAAQAFGKTMMQALDTLLASHSRHVLDQVNTRIGTLAHETGAQVAAMIEAAMRKTVHSMVEQELGPVSPPASPANEPAPIEAAPIPGETPPRKRLKIDVVGSINPPVRTLVRDQYSGTDIDIRFFEGGHRERYTPDPARHCIFVSKRASHGLFDKLKKYRIQPIYVEPSASYITHAIDELQRSAMQ